MRDYSRLKIKFNFEIRLLWLIKVDKKNISLMHRVKIIKLLLEADKHTRDTPLKKFMCQLIFPRWPCTVDALNQGKDYRPALMIFIILPFFYSLFISSHALCNVSCVSWFKVKWNNSDIRGVNIHTWICLWGLSRDGHYVEFLKYFLDFFKMFFGTKKFI